MCSIFSVVCPQQCLLVQVFFRHISVLLNGLFQDQQQQKKRQLLVASMSVQKSSQVSWEKGLMQQWRRQYSDPEKASRMGETLLKLCSAYKEGIKYKREAD